MSAAPSSRRTARATVGGGFPTRTLSVCAAGSQFPIVAVSVQPSSHPGRSDFPSPVGGDSYSPRETFPYRLKFKHSPAYASRRHGYIPGSTSCPVAHSSGPVSGSVSCRCLLPTESPFARLRRYRSRPALLAQVSGSYPAFIAHTGSCARPSSSCRLRSSLFLQVFAGCSELLPDDGPSRRYLCDPCRVAWVRTPPRCRGALVRFFPRPIGLAIGSSSSAHGIFPQRSFMRGEISGL